MEIFKYPACPVGQPCGTVLRNFVLVLLVPQICVPVPVPRDTKVSGQIGTSFGNSRFQPFLTRVGPYIYRRSNTLLDRKSKLLPGTKWDQRPVEYRDSGTVLGLIGISFPAGFYQRDCPAYFCTGPDCPVALSPGPNLGDLQDRDQDPDKSRHNRPSLGHSLSARIKLKSFGVNSGKQ